MHMRLALLFWISLRRVARLEGVRAGNELSCFEVDYTMGENAK